MWKNFTENKTSCTELDGREVRFAGLKIKNSCARATAKIRDELKQNFSQMQSWHLKAYTVDIAIIVRKKCNARRLVTS